MLLIELLLLHHMDRGQGSSEGQFGTARDLFRSPSPVWAPSTVKSTGIAWQQPLQIGISTVEWL